MVDAWKWLPPTPPGFTEPLAIRPVPHHLEDADTPMGVLRGAQLDLNSLRSMQVIITWNDMIGELEYHYETRVISRVSQCLTPPDFSD